MEILFTTAGLEVAQGDGIDMKAALTNVTITQNMFYALGTDVRGIVTQGQTTAGAAQNIVIERNYLHDMTVDDSAIAIVNSWGTPKGVTIRNNIIDTIASGMGIKIYDGSELTVYNNTIYNAATTGIYISAGTVTVQNNLLLSNNGGGNNAQVDWTGTITQSNNGYTGTTFGETCTTCQSELVLASTVTDAANGVFSLVTDSLAINNGATIAGFANDYAGTSRPQGAAWDIGAMEWYATGQFTGSTTGSLR